MSVMDTANRARMTLRRQMILLIATPTLVIYIAILGVTAYLTYHEAKESRQRMMMQLATSYAAQFDGQLREAAQIARTTADFIENAGTLRDEQIYAQLERNVSRSLPVYGAAVAFEPGTRKPAGELFAPYVHRSEDGRGLRRLNIDASVYDWYRDPRYTWFTGPKLRGQSLWSEPYFDEGAGNVLMITYSAPFYPNGRFGGVVTVDIDLPRLQQTVGRNFQEDLGFFILDTDGRFVFDAESSRILEKTIFDLAKEKNRPELEALGRRMQRGTSGVVAVEGLDVPGRQWVVFAPIRSTKWMFACRFSESVVLASVRKRAIWNMTGLSIALLMIIVCIAFVARRISMPIARLSDKVAEVARGNLSATIEDSGGAEEFRRLTTSFNHMTSELRAHVARLALEQAARARIEYDLDIAREIQSGLLPIDKPSVPGYEFSGWSKPADKTGGDYYDWQTLETAERSCRSPM
jgi:HAMP domain-containing protein